MESEFSSFAMGHPNTVTKFGPSPLISAEQWTPQHANDLAHFVQLAELLSESEWFAQGAVLSQESNGHVSEFSCPSMDPIVSALTLIRQFTLRRDRVFHNAILAYNKFCGDSRKTCFVDLEFQQFQGTLDNPLHAIHHFGDETLAQLTGLELIDLIVYGSGIFHRESNESLETHCHR